MGTRVDTLHKTFGPKGFMAGVKKFRWGQWTAMAAHGYMDESSASQIKSFSDKFQQRYSGDIKKYILDIERYQLLTDGQRCHQTVEDDPLANNEIHPVGQEHSGLYTYFSDGEDYGL